MNVLFCFGICQLIWFIFSTNLVSLLCFPWKHQNLHVFLSQIFIKLFTPKKPSHSLCISVASIQFLSHHNAATRQWKHHLCSVSQKHSAISFNNHQWSTQEHQVLEHIVDLSSNLSLFCLGLSKPCKEPFLTSNEVAPSSCIFRNELSFQLSKPVVSGPSEATTTQDSHRQGHIVCPISALRLTMRERIFINIFLLFAR